MTDGNQIQKIKIGDIVEDGTVFAGVSPDTGEALYCLPCDVPITMEWDQAWHYTRYLNVSDYSDWRLPTKAELHVLRENHNEGNLRETFNTVSGGAKGWYWSSEQYHDQPTNAWQQRMHDGYECWFHKKMKGAIRPVRTGPMPL